MLLSAAIGGGWLAGVAALARTAVAVVPVAGPDDPEVTEAAGVRIDGPRVGSARTGDTNWKGGAVPVLRIFGDYECGACRELDVEAGDSLRALARAGSRRSSTIVRRTGWRIGLQRIGGWLTL